MMDEDIQPPIHDEEPEDLPPATDDVKVPGDKTPEPPEDE